MDEMTTLRVDPRLRRDEPPLALLGDSPAMARVRELTALVAGTDATVLVRGESGTGKELGARALSAGSLRRDKPFVEVNCAALPAELLESEMFGFLFNKSGAPLQEQYGASA
jgi:formate hydrogenlyase transcriptional activator